MRRKIWMTAAALAAIMLFGGCGPEAYDLTEQEESLIVSYSAHVVAKYNRFQTEGLKYVNLDAEEELPAEEIPEEKPSEEPEDTESQAPADGEAGGEEIPSTEDAGPVMQTASLDDLFGTGDVHITYAGAELVDSFVEDTYFAMYPDAGSQYLIRPLSVATDGDTAAEMDVLKEEARFTAKVNGEYTAASAVTMLTEDFSCLKTTLEAGEVKETVLIFQVPVSVTEIKELTLVISSGEDYQIIL